VIALLALFGLAILFPISVGLAVLIGRRPVRRRLLKILVSATAGGVCGMLWVVFIATICAADRPGVLTDPVLIVVGVVVALSGAVLISGPGRLGEVVGRSLVTTGFTSLALPIAALISFLVTGAQVSPGSSSRSELSAVILGVRLAGDVTTASLSVGGLLDSFDMYVSRGAGRPPQPRRFEALSRTREADVPTGSPPSCSERAPWFFGPATVSLHGGHGIARSGRDLHGPRGRNGTNL
jgi:hypothetical protein